MSGARRALVAIAVAAAVGAGACGGSDDPAYCDDRAQLEESLRGLGDVDVTQGGVAALEAQLREIEADATALVASAREQFGPQASALRTAVARLEDLGRAAAADPSAQSLSALADGISSATSAFGELSDAISSSC